MCAAFAIKLDMDALMKLPKISIIIKSSIFKDLNIEKPCVLDFLLAIG